MKRRTVLGTITGVSLAGLAGCTGDGDDGNDGGSSDGTNEIAVGPDGSLAFDPESITVSAGTTVTWNFESPSHNVSCVPDHHDRVSLPDGAEPFASVDHDSPFSTNDQGETFEHTFDTNGEYTYVCTPHAASGMVGTVVVEE